MVFLRLLVLGLFVLTWVAGAQENPAQVLEVFKSSVGASTSDRLHGHVKRKIDLIDKIASKRRLSAKLIKAKVRGDDLLDQQSTWMTKLRSKVVDLRETWKGRMANMYPKPMSNRASTSEHTDHIHRGTGVESRLARHGDPDAVASAVIDLAGQRLPREKMWEHLRSRFPHLENGEVTDLIGASFLHVGKAVPRLSDLHEQDRTRDARIQEQARLDNVRAPPAWFQGND